MKVHLTPAAEADVREIYAWCEAQGEGLATEFKRALDASRGRIGRNPRVHAEVHGQARRAEFKSQRVHSIRCVTVDGAHMTGTG